MSENIPALPFERPSVLEIAPTYPRLQAEQPVARVRTPAGDLAWLVTRHHDVRDLLADQRLGRSHPEPERAARFSGAAVLGGPTGSYETERADHAAMRRALVHSFAARRMQLLRPAVQATADALLDAVAAAEHPVALHQALSFPLPVLVICDLLGVLSEDREDFRGWSADIANMREAERARAGLERRRRFMSELLRRRRGRPAEDVVSDLLALEAEGGHLEEHAVAGLMAGLLFAGHETTVARIDFGTPLFLTEPEQLEALHGDPSLLEPAVEEVLRLAAPGGTGLPRYAHGDIELHGVRIERGDAVLLAISAANRDPAVFTDPGRFDIGRQPNPHLAFGHGQRFCMGASLARLELQVVFGTLLERFPSLRLAVPLERLKPRTDLLTGGLDELPVAL